MALVILLAKTSLAAPLGTAWTYQGRLTAGDSPAKGNYDLQFKLFDALADGVQQGGTIVSNAVAVSNGLFTVTLDFGAGVFDGSARWLEIAVRTNNGPALTTLTPRQSLTAAPYALYALTPTGPQGPVGPTGATGPQGPIGLTGAPGSQGPTGTTGPEGLPGAPGATGPQGPQGAPGAPGLTWRGTWSSSSNYVADDAVQASGSAWLALRANNNVAPAEGSDWTLLVQVGATGPQGPTGLTGATGPQGPTGPTGVTGPAGPPGPSVVTGNSPTAVIAGSNTGSGPGVQGTAADTSVLGVSVLGDYGYLGGARYGAYGSNVLGNSGSLGGASSGVYGYGAGANMPGVQGTNVNGHAVRGDSLNNVAVVGINGAATLDVSGNAGVYGISGSGAGVQGESDSGDGVVGASYSGYAGHFYGAVKANGLILSDTGLQATNSNGHAVIGNSLSNIAVVGINGAVPGNPSGNGGVYGVSDMGYGVEGASGGGDGVLGISLGGYAGHFYGPLKATGVISSDSGLDVRASRNTGYWNDAVAYLENLNSGASSSPALRVVANGDAPNGALSVSTQGTGLIARFGNNAAWVAALDTNGNWSATSFNPSSDRGLKENFKPVSPSAVLDKVAALPISEWNFKTEPATRHLGPMAQDFAAAFGTGSDDKHIATVDADGVALAAIQGLNQKVERQRTELDRRESEITELKQAVSELKDLLQAVQARVGAAVR